MSRFFRAADDSDSSTETESSSSEDEVGPAARTTVGGVGRSRFLASDSEDEDVQRVSRSAKDRRFDELNEVSNNAKNHIKNLDWSKLQEDFDLLNESLKKFMKTDMVSGRKPPVPEIYLRAVVTIEEFLTKTLAEKPKLSKTNATSLNRMRLKVPKNNKHYKAEIAALRATGKYTLYDIPEDSEKSDESESESESESEYYDSGAEKPPARPGSRFLKKPEKDDDSESETEESSSEDSDESSDDDGPSGKKRSIWLRKDTSAGATTSAKHRKGKKMLYMKPEDPEDGERADDDDDGFTVVSRTKGPAREVFNPDEMTEESVDSKMIELLQSRGRKGTNRLEQIRLIESLSLCAKSPRQSIEVKMHLIAAKFDGIPVMRLFMPAELWRSAIKNAMEVIALASNHFPSIRFSDEADALVEDPNIMLKGGVYGGEIVDPTGEAVEGTAAKPFAEEPTKKMEFDAEGQIIVRGDIVSTFERFDDELYRAWQHTDAYTPEYVNRLKDEVLLLDLASAIQSYFENAAEHEEGKDAFDEIRLNALRSRAARIAGRRVTHMYYKSSELINRMEELTKRKFSDKSLTELAVMVYRYGDERAKSMIMLAHIYNHALENRFFAARDMLLMSHLQETIYEADIPMMVMFNRTMTQLGLCAFRMGKPWEAHACLQELCSPSYGGVGGGLARMKELLAQGITMRGYDKSPEQEKAEARRQVPYHMHINLDFIETAHLTSAMLLEVPSMALSKARGDVRRWPISKSFQYFLRNSMKQAFPGPPENTRDFIMFATRCLMRGDWKGAYDYIAQIRSWKSLTLTIRAETQERLKELLKVEALRTFSSSYSSYFDSMATEQLSQLFGMTPAKVHSVLSKMIVNAEMRASWDQPTASIVMRRTEPSRLQSLALQLSSKVANMTENNEKLMDARGGGGGDRGDRKEDGDRGKGGDWKSGGRNTRGGRGRGKDRDGGSRTRNDGFEVKGK